MATGSGVGGEPASLVLTLEMDGESFAALDALRRRYYAPERNLVPAHVTLFHRLPAERSREIKALLEQGRFIAEADRHCRWRAESYSSAASRSFSIRRS